MFTKNNFKIPALINCILIIAVSLLLGSCNLNAEKKPEEKQKYIIPDSILNTIKIDTVQKCQLINSIT
jgi:cobalt-zinc-cadmium efflux system membrane fusion protein